MYCTTIEYHTNGTLVVIQECTGTDTYKVESLISTLFNNRHSLRQSDIVDYRAAYFAAKKMIIVEARAEWKSPPDLQVPHQPQVDS